MVVGVLPRQVSINALVVCASDVAEVDRAEVPFEPLPRRLLLCFGWKRITLS